MAMLPRAGLTDALKQVNRLVHEGADVLAARGEEPHELGAGLLHALARYRAALEVGNPREIARARAEANRALRAAVERLVAAAAADLRRGPRRRYG